MDSVESRRMRSGAARKLQIEHVAIAEKNSSNERFQDKFTHPRRRRRSLNGLPASPWAYVIVKWRKQHELYAKEAANRLGIPVDTLRGWEAGKHVPGSLTRDEVSSRMRAYDKSNPKV